MLSRAMIRMLVLLLLFVAPLEAAFLSEPMNKNATLNINATASFYCQAENSTSIGWTINGSSEKSDHLQEAGVKACEENGNNISSTLFIPTTTEFNNSEVICILGLTQRSDPVVLKIQGLLDSPSNLKVRYFADNYHHQLQWDAPFTLDITDVDPDISGYTICNNITGCVNVTEQFFRFSSICTPVLFNVSAVNIVGTGASASLEYIPSNYSQNRTSIETETSFDVNHIPTVSLSYQEIGGCYYFINVSLTSMYSSTHPSIGPILPTVDCSGTARLSISDLPDNDNISAIVTEHTEGLWSLETTFSTFDVMAYAYIKEDKSIEVVCKFARGSNALGCYVMVSSVDGVTMYNESAKAYRELDNDCPISMSASSTFTDLDTGNYSVAVFDIEFDDSVLRSRIAYHDIITVSSSTAPETLLGILFSCVFVIFLVV